MRRATVLVILAELAGCRGTTRYDCDAGACRGSTTTGRWEVPATRILDMLFIVDPVMLASDLPRVRSAMMAFAGEPPRSVKALDLHIAVVSSVLDPVTGDPTSLLAAPGQMPCASREVFLAAGHKACGVVPNFEGFLEEALACLAPGAGGDGASQPLEVARRLMSVEAERRPAAWRDFIRPGSARMVLIISPRDDDSPTPTTEPAALAAYVGALASGRNLFAISLVTSLPPSADGGVPEARCAVARGETPPSRLLALREALRNNVSMFDVCAPDWTPASREAYEFLPVGHFFCLPPGARDVDEKTPGIQPDCIVRQRTPTALGSSELLIPPCTSGQRPCVEFRSSGICVESPVPGMWVSNDEGAEVVVMRDCIPPPHTELEVVCAAP